jgi:hypothetical protein
MPITKVFAIEASQEAVWNALWSDLQSGDADAYSVLRSSWPSSFTVEVALAGLPTLLSYAIEPRDGYCEVSVELEALSLRYRMLQVLTLGRMRLNYELLLAQSLANLKAALEDDAAEA